MYIFKLAFYTNLFKTLETFKKLNLEYNFETPIISLIFKHLETEQKTIWTSDERETVDLETQKLRVSQYLAIEIWTFTRNWTRADVRGESKKVYVDGESDYSEEPQPSDK